MSNLFNFFYMRFVNSTSFFNDCIRKIKTSLLVFTFLHAFSFDVTAQCDVNNPYDKIISSFHSSIALKSDGTYAVWGQLMNNNGTSDVLAPQDINSTN